jgi:protein-S-isoprenylcysteine O-methyltransferase Ste14
MARRVWALIGSAIFLVVAPGFIAGLAPYWIAGWRIGPPFLGIQAMRWLGGALIVLGGIGLLECFARFALQGLGTPAPIAPPLHLVVKGSYRFVRNPMYVAVTALIVGQALLLGSAALIAYAALIAASFHLFVVLYEEPTLRGSFGVEYQAFCKAVPRWLPRLTPWRGA